MNLPSASAVARITLRLLLSGLFCFHSLAGAQDAGNEPGNGNASETDIAAEQPAAEVLRREIEKDALEEAVQETKEGNAESREGAAAVTSATDAAAALPDDALLLERARELRQQAEADEAAAHRSFAEEEARCYRKVFVNDCLNAAKSRRIDQINAAKALDLEGRRIEREVKRREVEARKAEREAESKTREADLAAQGAVFHAEQARREAERERRLVEKARQAEEFRKRNAEEEEKRRQKMADRARRDAEREAKKAEEERKKAEAPLP